MYMAVVKQSCPNFTFGGFLHLDLGHLKLIFWVKIWYTIWILLGPGKFLMASKWGSKGKTLPVDQPCPKVAFWGPSLRHLELIF
jgi:hypothetical protein